MSALVRKLPLVGPSRFWKRLLAFAPRLGLVKACNVGSHRGGPLEDQKSVDKWFTRSPRPGQYASDSHQGAAADRRVDALLGLDN